MEDVSQVIIGPAEKSHWMKPYTIHFNQNGRDRAWDILSENDSLAIILFNKTRKVLLFVRQFRPAVYVGRIPEHARKMGEEVDTKKYRPHLGITLELCAGLVDKKKSLEEIAREEILEECGYDVPLTCLEKIGAYRRDTGNNTGVHTDFYCEITDDMKVSSGGGIGDELIEVVEMTIEEARCYLKQNYINSPPGFIYSLYWFLYNKD